MRIAEFEIEVERKPIKNIHLAVYPPDARVHVSVPELMREDDISMYLYSKIDWIRNQYDSVKQQERQSDREFISGENHYLFGQRYLLMVKPSTDRARAELTTKCIDMYVRPGATLDKKQQLLDDLYRTQLKAVLADYVAKWASVMDEDISTFSWSVLRMQKLWGNCTTGSRKIKFNLMLARVPLRCIEYVVVHELNHLKVHEHNKMFAALLSKYMPDWATRKRELDEFIALPIS